MTTAPSGHEKQIHKSFFTNGPALWLLCCALPMWLGAQVPQGTFSGNTICPGGQATLTFTATLGTGPYTVRYTDGNAIRTQLGVVSGVPFNAVSNTTATKTYTLLHVTGLDLAVRSNGFTDASAQVTVLPRPDLQSLTLAPIAPVCPGADATLKINGFVQAQSFEPQTAISTSADAAQSVYAADLDGDGDLDVLSASSIDNKIAWYKNDGSGGFTAQTAISTTANDPYSVYAADLDGDGNLDVLSASEDDDKIAWYKNNGSGVFTEQTAISTTADGARSVYAADLDRDGNMDVLSASFNDNKIAWYKNNGSGVFTEQTAISTTANFATSVYAADLDLDGNLDVLSASGSSKIEWYKNDGNGVFTAQAAISTTADAAQSVYAADLDGDGDLDVLSASYNDHKIAWYKNNGSGVFTTQPAITTSAIGAFSVYAADLDGDGDLDVLSASFFDDKIAWYKNNGSGVFTEQAAISTSADGARSVYAADLNGDGDLDVLSASALDDKIVWYKGRAPFNGNATVTYTAGGGAPQTAIAPVSAGMAIYTLPAPKAGTLNAIISATAGVCAASASESAQLRHQPRPDLQSLAIAPIDPVCPGVDATLKLNGFVQAQSFETQTAISTSNIGSISVYAADLDGDGDLDVLSAAAIDNKIAWYKNDGSGGFTAQAPISTTSTIGVQSVYAADLDGDGGLDVLSASVFDDKIAWYKNNGSGVFTEQTSISTSADGARSVHAADLDGDGDLDVLSASLADNKIAWYKNDGSGAFTAQTAISTSANGAQSVYAADLDGDGDMDVLSASELDDKIAWYKNDGSGAFTAQTAISTSANGAYSVYAADLDGDGDLDVLSASRHDHKIAWYQNNGSGAFTSQTAISTSAIGASSVYTADLDGDGNSDVLSASFFDNKIAWYQNNGSGAFTAQTPISTTADGAISVYAADLDGDGDLDVLSAYHNKIAWYKNRTPFNGSATVTYTAGGGEPQTATAPVSAGMATYPLPGPKAGTLTVLKVSTDDGCTTGSGKTTPLRFLSRPDLQDLTLAPIAPVCSGSDATLKLNGFVQAQSFETQAAISTSANNTRSVYSADLDGDGDMDVLSVSFDDNKIFWYQNNGSGVFTTQLVISTTANGASSVYAADLDGDGDLDVLSASLYDNKIAWYQNDGNGTFTTQPDISTAAVAAQSVYAADLDGDGDMDVLSASNSDNKIAWYQNDGNGTFTTQPAISTSASAARSVYASDLDGDGDMDVLSASSNDDKIAWYRNDGSGGFTAQPAISTTANGAWSVYAADLDGDGDMDVLSASIFDSKIAWYKNDGSGGFTAQPAISTTANGARSVYASDLDGDGDLDVLSASEIDDKIAWYQNDGSGGFSAQTPISSTANRAWSVYASDLDGDGDLDVLSASGEDDKIAWYENRTPLSGSATVTYTAGGGEPQTTTVPVSAGMATFTLPAPKAGTLSVLKVSSDNGCTTGSGKTTPLRFLPRPDLQDLTLAPIAPVCSGSDATLKLNGFVQAQSFETQAAISTTADDPYSVYAADLDGDGDLDVLSASLFDDKIAWYKNDGNGGFIEQAPISISANAAHSVYAADLDGDGNLDVLSASFIDDKIAWYKNDGSGGFTEQMAISTTADGTQSVYAADLDGDGDIDVLSTSVFDDKIAWYKNDGSGGFTEQMAISTSADGAVSVYAADLDSDGDMDVLSASQNGAEIAWYKNGGNGSFTEQMAISTSAVGAQSVYAADLDGDGDLDVLSASAFDDKIAWYKNDGSGSFTEQMAISTSADLAYSVYAADLDGDGDLDVLSASAFDNKIAWYKNDGIGGFTEQMAISTSANRARSVHAADLDGDGDLDVLSASFFDDKIAWYENRTPFSGNAAVMFDLNSGTSQTASSPVSMGMASLTVPVTVSGTLTVTKVTNAEGCSATTSKAIPVTLLTPPTFTACPTNKTAFTSANACTAVVDYIATADGDPASVMTYALTGVTTGSGAGTGSGTTFNKGVTTVTLTATNDCGAPTCQFTVTVTDNVKPIITCPDNRTVNADQGQCSSVQTYTVTTTDNCSATTQPTAGLSSGAAFPVGITINAFLATDAAGNTSTCSFSIRVLDTHLPIVTCPANTTLGIGDNCSAPLASYGLATKSDNCSTAIFETQSPVAGTIVTGHNTAQTVTLTATDGSGNTASCSFVVTLKDVLAPSITCPANIIRPTDLNLCGAVVTYATPIYTDNCSGGGAVHLNGGTSGSTFAKGTTIVNWQATDGVGLTKTCSFTVTVNDAQAPTITCPANIVRSNDAGQCNASVAYPTPKASDNCSLPAGQPQWVSGGTTPTASGANSVSTFQKGANIVTWRATDGAGLTKTCTFRVTINDTEAPTMTCPAAMNLVTATNTCNAVATYTNPTFTDNCAPTSGTATRISGLVSGSTFPVGNSNVVFQATDAAGNTRRCTMVITVTDNQAPVITCPTPVVVNGSGTPCNAIVFYGSTTASDNCTPTLTPFLVNGLASGSAFPVGVTTNTFRAVAPNGQSSECSFAVTVNCGSGMGNNGVEVRDADLSVQYGTHLDLKLTPNPALSTVTVSIEGVGAGGGTLLVYDAVGRLILRQVVAENQQTAVFQVEGSAFTPGMYRVNLRTASGMVTKTLVVVK